MLSFEKAPPFAAPLRFFLTAPLFAVAAGLLVAVEGDMAFLSRWTPAALAATHLMTVGFMLQIMLGALIQVLPVVAGVNLEHPLRVARIVHAGLTSGALLLASGFVLGKPLLLVAAVVALVGAALVFLAATGPALLAVPATSPTMRGLKIALPALAAVVLLGAVLALALAFGWPLPLPAIADLHAGWGLGGWAGVLLAAIAYVVVPMFQLTPGYPARSSFAWPALVAGLLAGWTLGLMVGSGWLVQFCQLLLALAGAAFAALTLRLLGQRRRARADATYRYWQLGLLASLAALVMLATAAVRPEIAVATAWTPAFGVLVIAGGFVPLIIGMLYKIVPFMAWMHLQEAGRMRVPAPPMNKLLADRDADRQWLAYVGAFVLVLAAAVFPAVLARPAGVAFAAASAWLWWNLFHAWRRYRHHGAEIAIKLAAKESEA